MSIGTSKGLLCIPTEYFRMALIGAAKFKQDPRSPRKSAMDLFKAGVANLTDLCSLGVQGLGLSRSTASDYPAKRYHANPSGDARRLEDSIRDPGFASRIY